MAANTPGKLFGKNKSLARLPHSTLNEFAQTSTKDLPERVPARKGKLYGGR